MAAVRHSSLLLLTTLAATTASLRKFPTSVVRPAFLFPGPPATASLSATFVGVADKRSIFLSGSRWSWQQRQHTTMASVSGNEEKGLVVDRFCFRQFSESEASKSYRGAIFSVPVSEFESIVNSRYNEADLRDGYAPFCKHIFIKNDFTDAQVNVLPITDENEHCIRSSYDARNEKELPVLTRYFPRELVCSDDNPLPVAKYLDLILYSRDQINKESDAMGKESSTEMAPWGIVSIKAQDVNRELPMTPITAMRNALGKDQGGSGVPIDRDAYMAAHEYWKDHATLT